MNAALLSIVPLLWGCGWVAYRFVVTAYQPIWSTAYRFTIAAIVIAVLARRRLRELTPGRVLASARLGMPLFLSNTVQALGFARTSIARASFVSSLYAVIVPLLTALAGRERPGLAHLGLLAVVVAGLLLLTGVADSGLGAVGWGDAMVLAAAFFSSLQIVAAGSSAIELDPLLLNLLQTAWVGLCSVPSALLLEGRPPPLQAGVRAELGMLYLVVSAVLSFTLQIHYQRAIAANLASVMLLLQAPIGTLAGVLWLNERQTPLQWAGTATVLATCAAAPFVLPPTCTPARPSERSSRHMRRYER